MSELPPRANLRPAEIAEFLGVSKSKIYDLVAADEIPSIRIGSQIRIPRDRFLKWYESRVSDTSGSVSV